MANAITIAVSVTGSGQAASGLGNVVKGLLSVGSAMMIIRKGLKYVTDASDAYKSWESAMADANRQMRLGSGELAVLSQRLLATSGPLQNITDLYEQAPDAMGRMSSAGEDNIHMLEDLNDIAILSAVTHTKLGDTADTTMGIMRSFGMANGEANRATRILVGTGQEAVGTFEEVTGALRELAPVFNVTEEEAETTAAALATMTKAGFSASASGAALRIGWGKMQTDETRDKLAKLGITVTDFAGTMQQIKDKGLTEEDWAGILGVRQYAQFAGMIAHWDEFGTILETIKTADPAGMFDAFAATAEAAGVRIENEFNRRLIEIGAAVEPARRELKIFTTELEVMGTEVAAFLVRNKELATSVAAAIAIVSQAIKGTLTKTPLGRLLIIMEGLIFISSALSAAFGKDTRASLDMTNALQDSVDKGIAQIQTTEDQVEAEMEAARARKDGAERVAELAGELENLRAKEADLVGLQSSLARSATELESALLAEELATTLTGNAFERTMNKASASAQAAFSGALKSWRAGLTTVEGINAATDDMVNLNVALAGAVGDEAKTREIIAGFLSKTLGMNEDMVRASLSEVSAQELSVALTQGMNTLLENQRGILKANEAALLDGLKHDQVRLGIYDKMLALKEGSLEVSKLELGVLLQQVGAEKIKLQVYKAQAQLGWEKAVALGQGAAAELYRGMRDAATAQLAEVERQLAMLRSYHERGAAGAETEEYEETVPGGAQAAQGAADATSYQQGYQGVTRDELARARQEQEDAEIASLNVKARAEMESNKEVTAAAIAADEERMKSLAHDLAGIFEGAFTDASWNAADSFKNFFMQALDDLLVYALEKGLFSFLLSLLGGGLGGIALGNKGGVGGKWFGEGGYVNRPTLAMVGEKGPEFIIPKMDVMGALAAGPGAVENLLARLSGQPVRGPVPSGAQGISSTTTMTTVNQIYAPVIGSLDKLDDYGRMAGAGHAGRGL